MVSFGLGVLLVASWVVGLLAAGAFLLALLGAATMVLTLSQMTPETASRYVWTWSLSIPLPCLFFAESLRHTPSLVTLATALGVGWFYFILCTTLLVGFMRARN
jgi:energy-converting hydrogenase Eha subunit A